jgi:hypothetical protein
MVRNVILLVSTLAVLMLLFVGYQAFVREPAAVGEGPTDAGAALPTAVHVADESRLPLGPIEVEPGEKMAYVEYDPVTGRPTDYFRLDSWEKVPGTQNEVRVTRPELMMRLPSGMIVTVTADRGQIKAERLRAQRLRPKLGWLEGHARIVVDRETSFDRTPLSERPEDQITIETSRLDFNLELGELNTDGPLRVSSPEFDVSGTGLHFVWNQADNRIEELIIERGGRMVLQGASLRLLDAPREHSERPRATPSATTGADAVAPPSAPSERRSVAYRCVFSGGVDADHYVGDERAGGLHADELMLLFDVRRGERGLPRRQKATATAPTTQPAERPARRLVLRWNGRLALHPAPPPAALERPRRRLEARGRPLTVTLPNQGQVRCARLVLHEGTRRLWLYPAEDGLVELSSAGQLSVKAASIFVDLDRNVVKLVGDVLFQSSAGAGPSGQPLTIRCDLWAELHLATELDRGGEPFEDVFDNPLASRPPESAVFVGHVQVDYEAQTVRAHRLDAYFRTSAEPEGQPRAMAAAEQGQAGEKLSALRAMLESAVATGNVRLVVAESSPQSTWRQVLEQQVDVVEQALVRSLSETTRTQAQRQLQREARVLECDRLHLGFATEDGVVRVRDVEGTGALLIYDRDSRFAARGRRLAATFTPEGELQRATVGGSERAPAVVRARAYALRGHEIKADNQARTLHVDGPSTLAFRSRRSLQGRARRRPEPITVTSSRSLHIDDRRNTVDFSGQVVAGTGDEQLLADALKLLLEDVEPTRPPSAWSRLKSLVRRLRGSLGNGTEPAALGRSILAATRARGSDRKELARILARNAVLQSETYAPGDELPLVHQSVAAPELESDVRQRWLRTSGQTTLLLTDRRLRGGADATRSALGIPSALVTRGPSQTAMQCRRSLMYVLGKEGPQRQDSVLFEGRVRFRHVAGREMVNLEQMLPEVVRDPALLETLETRNTYVECDRFEGLFTAEQEAQPAETMRRLRPSLQLSWLNARGNVYLRDQHEDSIREVYAHQLEFDRPGGLIRVLGLPEAGIDARVYDENSKTGRFSMPVIAPEVTIDLKTNTIRGRQIRGQASD